MRLTRPFSRADIVRMATLLPGPFTVEMYQKLGELGIFHQDDRVELIAGQVVEMSPIGDHHAACVRRLNRLCSRYGGEVAIVDVQNPVVLGEHDAPQPDLVLLKPRPDAYPRHPHATDILLIIEVADTTLAYDRDIKMPVYACAGIPEAWLVDLNGDAIMCYRAPAPDGYEELATVTRGTTLRPVGLPEITIEADEILGAC